jgi:hypothetical protein
VVLFDGLEDAAFNEVHGTAGPGSLSTLFCKYSQKKTELAEKTETPVQWQIEHLLHTQFTGGYSVSFMTFLKQCAATMPD